MNNQFEAPELTLIGAADEVILGIPGKGDDHIGFSGADFEFEQD